MHREIVRKAVYKWRSKNPEIAKSYNKKVREFHRSLKSSYRKDIKSKIVRHNLWRKQVRAHKEIVNKCKDIENSTNRKAISKALHDKVQKLRGTYNINRIIRKITCVLKKNAILKSKYNIICNSYKDCLSYATNLVEELELLKKNHHLKSQNSFKSLQEKCIKALTSLNDLQMQSESFKNHSILLECLTGPSEHLSTDMPYFCDRTTLCDAGQNTIIEPIIVDAKGTAFFSGKNVENGILVGTKYKWDTDCTSPFQSPIFCKDTLTRLQTIFEKWVNGSVTELKSYFQNIDNCSSAAGSVLNMHYPGKGKMGHPICCHDGILTDPLCSTFCKSDLLFLNFLRTHYPKLGQHIKYIYKIIQCINTEEMITECFQSENVHAIFNLYKQIGSKEVFKEKNNLDNRPTCKTKSVKTEFKNAFETYYDEMDDLPVNVCLSCHGLKRRNACVDLQLTKTIKFDHLRELFKWTLR